MYYINITDIRLRVNKKTNMPYLAKRINSWKEEMLTEIDEKYILMTIQACHVSRMTDGRLLLKNKKQESIQIIITIEDEKFFYEHYGIEFKVDSYHPSRPKAY